ncbi:MAG: hypothetical protein L6R39_006187, partial [Caloplaca ligustica]
MPTGIVTSLITLGLAMPGSPKLLSIQSSDAVQAKPVLPLSPSFTGWNTASDVHSYSLPPEASSETPQHQPSFLNGREPIDLTLDAVCERDPALADRLLSSPIRCQAVHPVEDCALSLPITPESVDLIADSQPSTISDPATVERIPGSHHASTGSLQPGQESNAPERSDLEQSISFDLTQDFSDDHLSDIDEIMIIPKKHRKQPKESSQPPAYDLTEDHVVGISKHTLHLNGSVVSENLLGPKAKAISTSDHSTSASIGNPDETAIDRPMPRLLPKFAKKSLFDLTAEDQESTTEDDSEDVITNEELNTWLRSQAGRDTAFDIYGISPSLSTKRAYTPKPRNIPVEYPFCILETFTYNGIILRKGVDIELRDNDFVDEGDNKETQTRPHNNFMRIIDVIQDTRSQAVTVRGWIFQRAQYLNGILEKKRNELCWVMHIDEDDERDMKVQAMETAPVEDVVRRRKIRLTNQAFPRLSFREDPDMLEDSEETIRNERVLVCRYKYVCYYVSAERREKNSWSERCLQRLRHADCDKWSGAGGEACAMDDSELRQEWRGETIPGGAFQVIPEADSWRERMVDIARKSTDDLTSEILKHDRETTVLASTSRSNEQPFQITGIATRVDWITTDGVKHYTINGCVPKRKAEEDLSSEVDKRHRNSQFALKVERPPPTVSMVSQLMRRKSSIIEVAPWTSIPRSTEPRKPDIKPIKASDTCQPEKKKRQYTFGDSFCGAGGMSRAAHQTGLHIKYAFDCNKHACTTYAMNFPQTDLHCLWAHDFVQQKKDFKVDIAHLSPPCQFFSPAHTVAGKDDEMNTASLFAVGEILKKSKPRVVTLEQTFGIVLRARHQG